MAVMNTTRNALRATLAGAVKPRGFCDGEFPDSPFTNPDSFRSLLGPPDNTEVRKSEPGSLNL